MKTRLQVSFEIGDVEQLQKICTEYAQKLELGMTMTLLDAMKDPHCYFGEGVGGTLFLWGIFGHHVYVLDIIQHSNDLWYELISNGAIRKGTPVLFLRQSISEGSLMAYIIYGVTEDGYVLVEAEELPIDWVVYNL